jgi:endonuclease/exonuclease/phosphatase family metal-dependent hydrolase
MARGERLVLGGDLNGPPGDMALAPLTSVPSLVSALLPAAPPTYPTPAPALRLDHLFAGPGLEVVSARVVTEPGDASDHLPVEVVLRLS